MPQLFDSLYEAAHKHFDLPIERLVALLRVALTSFCLIALATAPERQLLHPQIFELILAAYILFGLAVVVLAIAGTFRTGWQLPVHLIDIAVISILMYFLQLLSTTFVI